MVLAPQRLPYEIQMASGWDVGYPPEELDLVLRFSCGHSRIRKIQILSHQYKIPSRLDFWMGSRKGVQSVSADPTGDTTQSVTGTEADQDGACREHGETDYDEDDDGLDLIPRMPIQKNLPVLQFQKLGSISFDSNAASNYSGRELRSINFDVEGEYLRVVIRQCHVNPLNIYHQVKLKSLDDYYAAVQALKSRITFNKANCQVAILALNVLGEPLEDELLADSERLDFDECEVVNGPGHGFSETSLAHPPPSTMGPDGDVQNLVSAVPALSVAEIKEQHADYMDQEMKNIATAFINAKLNAVKVEDFQSAKLFKTGYDEMTKFADRVQELDTEKHHAAENDDFDLAQELKAKVADVKARMHSQLSLNGFFIISEGDSTIVSLTPPDTIDEDVGDETSFAGSKTGQSGLMQEEESIILSKELTEQEQMTFAIPLQVFSAKIISGLISRELQLRQHAIEHVKEHLENECYADEADQVADPTLLAKAAFQVISVVLADTREKVVTMTLALLEQAVKSRVGIVARLVDEFGVYDSGAGKGTPGGLDFENITEFAIPYLSHTNGEVRVATRRLIIDVCKFLNKTRVEQFLPGVKPLIVESIQKELEPKRSTITPGHSPAPSRSTANTSGTATGPSLRATQSSSSSGKRRPIPTPLGVNLHMDSLKSLLVEPDSPGFSKTGRQSSRQRSETALAHQARLKMPLRQTAKATQDIYTGVPRAMVKKQSALSPDDENDSTASEETKTSVVPRTAARSLQPRSKVSATRPKLSGSDQQSGSDTPSQSKSAKDRFCVFCDERSSAFTDEGLVAHYWSDCAMLANCSYCKIIIEVPTLADHMLKECSRRKFVKQCESCKEIMPADSGQRDDGEMPSLSGYHITK
ncbi:hypothetical protein EC968_001185 [Mortierella alpina]|nr:hypothetical protein EC968_001185 [Mortierella alpina]